MRLLVATAVPPERDAVARAFGAPDTPEETALPGAVLLRTPGADVLAAGVGPAAAASATSAALTAARLAGNPYDLVVSAGIGGGFAERAPVGAVVVADRIVAADLGAETPDGFVPVTGLGFGTDVHVPPAALVEAAREAGLVPGAVLTVSTVTGSATAPPSCWPATRRRWPRRWRASASRRRPPRTAYRCWRSAPSPTRSAPATATPGGFPPPSPR
ncbi:hypothetical protein ACFQVA_24255 [Actinomadura keratinilytica]